MNRNYSTKTIKTLFALSRNKCAFPGCASSLVQSSKQNSDAVVVGEIAHIYPASDSGPRATSGDRPSGVNGHENLILLCPTHHTIIDKDPDSYPPGVLLEWKARIEAEADSDQAKVHRLQITIEDLTKRTLDRSGLVSLRPKGNFGRSELRLSDSLYVPRTLEQELLDIIEGKKAGQRAELIVGEPGVGKSSLFWSIATKLLQQLDRPCWFLEGTALLSLFTRGSESDFNLDDLGTLCDAINRRAGPPVLLIDTADICLNSNDSSQRFVGLLSLLGAFDVTVLIASRPEESRELEFLEPRIHHLGEYSGSEFVLAVQNYARRYTAGEKKPEIDVVVSKLLNAVAQGYPIVEVAYNPLRLRMLFSIYAPEDINVTEIDIVELYARYWRRRVENDVRVESRTKPNPSSDLSESAMLIGLSMLADGRADVAYDTILHQLESRSLNSTDLDELISRGVVRLSSIGGRDALSFFHQTFFEHSAAMAIALHRDAKLLEMLHDRFLESGGNRFLGCVLERCLVLTERSSAEVRAKADEVITSLCRADEPFHSAGLYAFAHRRTIPEEAAQTVEAKINAKDAATLERILSMSGNMREARRRNAITYLGAALEKGAYRLNEKILSFFLRSARQSPEEVAAQLDQSGLIDEFIDNPLATANARLLFLTMAPLLAQRCPEWTCKNTTALVEASLGRVAGDEDFRLGCIVLMAVCDVDRHIVIDAIKRISRKCAGDVQFGKQDTIRFGELICYAGAENYADLVTSIGAEQKDDAPWFLTAARISAIGWYLQQRWDADLVGALETVFGSQRKDVVFNFGKLAIAPLVQFVCTEDPAKADLVLGQIKSGLMTVNKDLVSLFITGLFDDPKIPIDLVQKIVDVLDADPSELWRPGGILFPRLIEATAVKIAAAEKSLEQVLSSKDTRQRSARPLIAQARSLPRVPESIINQYLELAFCLPAPADTIIVLLGQIDSLPEAWRKKLPSVEALIADLLKKGDPTSRTRAAKLVFHLFRLGEPGIFKWDELFYLARNEKVETAQAHFCGAARYQMFGAPDEVERRACLMIDHAAGLSSQARPHAIAAAANALKRDLPMAERHFPRLFEAAYSEPASSACVLAIAGLMYDLHDYGWDELPYYCAQMIENSKSLSVKASHKLYGTYAKLFLLVGRSAGAVWCRTLLSRVPDVHPEIARIILPLGLRLPGAEFAEILDDLLARSGGSGPVVKQLVELRNRREREEGSSAWPELLNV